MRLDNYGQLEQAVADADFILIGLGEEWVLTEDVIKKDLSVKNKLLYEMFLLAENDVRYQDLIPLLTAYYSTFYEPDIYIKAYANMLELLKGKNYFILSLTVDSYLKKTGFDSECFVNPCGTYEWIQCSEGCCEHLVTSGNILDEIKKLIEEKQVDDYIGQAARIALEQCLEIWENSHCECCGAKMAFNLLDAKKYREEGYLEQWNRYMKWLQGTLNKKLCVIEAGAGMKLPSVIRWPFEKTVFYNQKANMIRIHDKFYQVNEEVAERTYGCKCYSVKLFAEKNVEAYS